MELICFKCLTDTKIKDLLKIKINELGYGSLFDGFSTEVHLCRDCLNETPLAWWSLDLEVDEFNHTTRYKFEDDIMEYLEKLSVEGREKVFNEYNSNPVILLDKYAWIRYENGEMSKEEQREYGLIL